MINFDLLLLKCNNLHTENNLTSQVTLLKVAVTSVVFLKKQDWKVGSCTISIRRAEVTRHSSTTP